MAVLGTKKQSQTKPILRKGKRKNENKSGGSPAWGLKKQSQFIRTEYCVLCIAERKKAKMSVNLEFIRVYSWLI